MQRRSCGMALGVLACAVVACSDSNGSGAGAQGGGAMAASNAPTPLPAPTQTPSPGAAGIPGVMPAPASPSIPTTPASVAGSGAQVTGPGSGSGQAGSGAPAPAGPAAAGDPAAFNPYPDFKSEVYADDAMWACKPGLTGNPCIDQLDATEVLADGTTKPAPEDVSGERAVDCFYLYPTVNRPGDQSSRDFSNASSIIGVVRSQAARFSRVCNVYAPYYRLAGLMGGDIEIAYQDVLESFKHFIANLSQGRDFVLLGHSQGSNHGLRLLKEEFDDSPELIARMIAALMIGFPAQLPEGQATGGSFQNIPICQSAEQSGCLVNFMSYSADNPPASAGGDAQFGAVEVCTNPAVLGGGPALLQGTYFRPAGTPVASSVTTPWALYRDFFRAECKRTTGGTAYLAISLANQPGDQRMNFVDFNNVTGATLGIGLHVMDYTFPQGDLIDMLSTQIGARP